MVPLVGIIGDQKESRITFIRKWSRNTIISCDPAGLVQITKTPESRKYEKITKKMQNPPSRVGARKYEKNTEKIQKWPKNHHFCVFSVFFSYFRVPTREGGFCIFFVIFSYFRDSGVFVICTRPAGSQIISEIITFLIQKHFKTVTVTVILGKLFQMTFKTVIGNQ